MGPSLVVDGVGTQDVCFFVVDDVVGTNVVVLFVIDVFYLLFVVYAIVNVATDGAAVGTNQTTNKAAMYSNRLHIFCIRLHI